jgi:osmotically-inducible protein OsmY
MYYVDQWIRDEIVEKFVRLGLPGFAGITIKVVGGLVKLEGFVPSADIRNRYTDEVLKIDGVVSLRNNLKVRASSVGLKKSTRPSKSRMPWTNPGSFEIDK